MLIAIDIGNTQIKIGVYDKKELCFSSNIASLHEYTCDQYAIEIKNILYLYGCKFTKITGAIVSSVVPSVGNSVILAIKKLCGITPLMIGPGIKTGLNIKIDNPAQLGGDLVVGAVAAIALYPLPSIIFDFGTATKISVLDRNGSFLGCAITAGINISIDALAERTATLPKIVADVPKNIIGTNSVESMRSGLIYGNTALIDNMTARIERELGEKATIILTGGMAHLLKEYCMREVIFTDSLLLEGLRIIYEKNQSL